MILKNTSLTHILSAAVFCLIFVSVVFANNPNMKNNYHSNSTSVDNNTFINTNQILMFVTNHGIFGRDLSGVFGYDYGTWYPFTGNINDYTNHTVFGKYSPLYTAGLWIGGKVNNEIRVSVSEYISEFVPGPMANNTYMADQPEFKVYKLYAESLLTNPNQDYLAWPTGQGAPSDEFGHPIMKGNQMLWSVFNDANSAKHINMATTPLGIEIQMTTIADNNYASSLFLVYKIYNKGINTIDSCYLSFWSDPDVGSASDDFVGCDTLSNLWYSYNSSNSDANYGSAPPAIGFKLLYGPMVPSNGDSAYFDGNFIADYKNLSMTAFSHYFSGTDPDNSQIAYNYMRGKTRDGGQYYYLGNGISYFVSGDPVIGVGDIDTAPSDRRMMASTGPFTFAPGDSQFVMIKMSIESLVNNLVSITALKNTLNAPFYLPTDVVEDDLTLLPKSFSLNQNYPNPFNPTTQIKFSIPIRSNVTIDIFNLLGQKVKTLINKELSAGNHVVDWDASDVSTGLYIYKMTAGNFSQSKKMIFLK